jgi:hypothetical protein
METDAWPEWRCTVDIHKTMQAFADTWLCGSGPGAFFLDSSDMKHRSMWTVLDKRHCFQGLSEPLRGILRNGGKKEYRPSVSYKQTSGGKRARVNQTI